MKTDKQLFDGQKITAFIASDNTEASAEIKKLADESGFNGFIIDGIKNARHLEAIAHLNIAIAMSGGGTDAGFTYFQRK